MVVGIHESNFLIPIPYPLSTSKKLDIHKLSIRSITYCYLLIKQNSQCMYVCVCVCIYIYVCVC